VNREPATTHDPTAFTEATADERPATRLCTT
jgi:hypothetical protein